MKHLFFLVLVTLAACKSDVKLDTPITDARATFASLRNIRAPNCSVSNKGVTATYFSPDASFHLRFDQFAVVELDGKTTLTDAAVFQISPGVFVAEMRGGDYIRANVTTGTTTARINGVSLNFQKQVTP